MAWVGFALLLLAIGGGLAGLYTHRQNQEAAKHRQIAALKREVTALQQEIESNQRQLADRLTSVALKLKLKQYNLALRPIPPGEKILVGETEGRPATGAPPVADAPAAPSAAPSVMAVVGRP